MKAGTGATKSSWLSIEFVVRISDHHHGTLDRDLGVENFAVGMSDPEQLDSAKRLLIKVDCFRSIIHVDVWDDCIRITVRHCDHSTSPELDAHVGIHSIEQLV